MKRPPTPVYLAAGLVLCAYLALATRHGFSAFDNPVVRGLRSPANSVQHK